MPITRLSPFRIGASVNKITIVCIGVTHRCFYHLTEIVYACSTSAPFSGTVQCRKQYCCKDCDNGDNNQKFNQSKVSRFDFPTGSRKIFHDTSVPFFSGGNFQFEALHLFILSRRKSTGQYSSGKSQSSSPSFKPKGSGAGRSQREDMATFVPAAPDFSNAHMISIT